MSITVSMKSTLKIINLTITIHMYIYTKVWTNCYTNSHCDNSFIKYSAEPPSVLIYPYFVRNCAIKIRNMETTM